MIGGSLVSGKLKEQNDKGLDSKTVDPYRILHS